MTLDQWPQLGGVLPCIIIIRRFVVALVSTACICYNISLPHRLYERPGTMWGCTVPDEESSSVWFKTVLFKESRWRPTPCTGGPLDLGNVGSLFLIITEWPAPVTKILLMESFSMYKVSIWCLSSEKCLVLKAKGFNPIALALNDWILFYRFIFDCLGQFYPWFLGLGLPPGEFKSLPSLSNLNWLDY